MNRMIESIIKISRGELGNTEYPKGSNKTKYGEEYGLQGQPWCVIFLWWLFHVAELARLFFDGKKTASCSELLGWAKKAGRTAPKGSLRKGDITLLSFDGSATAAHCGLVIEDMAKDGSFRTIEGNTTPGEEGSQDNGGCVAQKVRYLYQVVAVIRPDYEEDVDMDYAGHWAEDSIKYCIDNGLMQGYPDGSFKPDEGITRAEVATILKRLDERNKGGQKK